MPKQNLFTITEWMYDEYSSKPSRPFREVKFDNFSLRDYGDFSGKIRRLLADYLVEESYLSENFSAQFTNFCVGEDLIRYLAKGPFSFTRRGINVFNFLLLDLMPDDQSGEKTETEISTEKAPPLKISETTGEVPPGPFEVEAIASLSEENSKLKKHIEFLYQVIDGWSLLYSCQDKRIRKMYDIKT